MALAHQTPWIDEKSVDIRTYWTFLTDEDADELSRNDVTHAAIPDAEVLFGLFVLLAVFVESSGTGGGRTGGAASWLNQIQNSERWLFADFPRQTFVARFKSVPFDVVQSELDKCQFTAEQGAFVWRRINRVISFVGDRSPDG